MRIAIVYDCLFPHTVGGAERWHRDVAERLAGRHDVTYLTRRTWPQGEEPIAPAGTRVIAVSRGGELYTASGRRKLLPPLRFGIGVLWHLLRHRREYDLIHTDAFPYFPLLAARAVARDSRPVVVDWFEVWTRDYWLSYLGRLAGRIGWAVQRLAIRMTPLAFTFSRLHAARLKEEGLPSDPIVLPGLWAGPTSIEDPAKTREPKVLFVGRLIPEKGVLDLPPAIASARRERPELTCTIVGDGPDRPALERVLSDPRIGSGIDFRGFADAEGVKQEMRSAMCLVLPSRREGFGAVVVEANAVGTPVVVLAHPDNAAVELIEPGANGIVVDSAEPEAIAKAILEMARDPERWRRSTFDWFESNASRVSVDASVDVIERAYERLAGPARAVTEKAVEPRLVSEPAEATDPGSPRPSISILIPVKDGGQSLVRSLEAIHRQSERDWEIVVVDSGSIDGSPQIAAEHGARVYAIREEEFKHGATRNLAAELARGEVLVFMSQDAEPVGTEWLGALVSPLRDDERLAGVYGRQLARNGAVPTERFFLDFVYGPEARTQELDDSSELTMHNTMFSNANAAVRRSLWERFRFADDIIMSEDQDWSRRVLLAGWRIAYQPEAAVLHSHVYTIDTAFRRFFDSGVSAERAYLAGSRASTRVLRREAIRYARQEISWLVQEGHARWIPYAVVYELAKFAGLQLGYRHRLLPVSVSRRLSAMPAYWSRDA